MLWQLVFDLPAAHKACCRLASRETPYCQAGKVKEQKHLDCITNSNFFIQSLLNLTSAHEYERVAACYGGHLAMQADQLGAGQPDIRWLIKSQDILVR